jgi:hypothetical protein
MQNNFLFKDVFKKRIAQGKSLPNFGRTLEKIVDRDIE